ncbi:MAG: methionine--tRNA ligase [Lachnospiraceae bacterium]|nr:methionine--tRNA ligase [Lachnospiraceae bacterium]
MRNILIGGAWPYANGSLHIGHIAGLLPGDVLARYHRAVGDNVYFVSGSDCHGTPVAIRAKKEGKTPQEISDHYHEKFVECFEKLGFSYDVYTKTSAREHKDFVRAFHEKLYQSKYVYEKETPQAYCGKCAIFLADRFVIGKCPKCGKDARGEQCDACGAVLEAENLLEPVCAICGRPISFRRSKHLYIAISQLHKQLKELVDGHPGWRKNAIAFTNRYIDEGLRDRALTRNLDWGISVPKEDYQDKTIYIWAENVLGYLSASKIAADSKGDDYAKLWGEDAKHYYVHGKDNIPFHTIILPALLIGNGAKWHLPDQIVSSEYLTLEGRKISTSRNYAIWVKDLLKYYDPDSIRYYFLANGPEKKDADFSWRDYVYSHNGELLGGYGNFVNRSLSFINKYWDGVIPDGIHDAQINKEIEELYAVTGRLIEKGAFKDAVSGIFDYVRCANKYFDTQRPWVTRDSDEAACKNTLYQCVQIIANLAVILYPFLPFSSEKVCKWLQLDHVWKPHSVSAGYQLPEIEILFNRIDKKVIEEETEKLKLL